jgi:hypothetical protein
MMQRTLPVTDTRSSSAGSRYSSEELREQLVVVQGDLQDLLQKRSAIEQTLLDAEALASELEARVARSAVLEHDNAELSAQLYGVETRAKSLEKDIAALRAQLIERNRVIADFNSGLRPTDKAVQYQTELEESHLRIHALEDEVVALRRELGLRAEQETHQEAELLAAWEMQESMAAAARERVAEAEARATEAAEGAREIEAVYDELIAESYLKAQQAREQSDAEIARFRERLAISEQVERDLRQVLDEERARAESAKNQSLELAEVASRTRAEANGLQRRLVQVERELKDYLAGSRNGPSVVTESHVEAETSGEDLAQQLAELDRLRAWRTELAGALADTGVALGVLGKLLQQTPNATVRDPLVRVSGIDVSSSEQGAELLLTEDRQSEQDSRGGFVGIAPSAAMPASLEPGREQVLEAGVSANGTSEAVTSDLGGESNDDNASPTLAGELSSAAADPENTAPVPSREQITEWLLTGLLIPPSPRAAHKLLADLPRVLRRQVSPLLVVDALRQLAPNQRAFDKPSLLCGLAADRLKRMQESPDRPLDFELRVPPNLDDGPLVYGPTSWNVVSFFVIDGPGARRGVLHVKITNMGDRNAYLDCLDLFLSADDDVLYSWSAVKSADLLAESCTNECTGSLAGVAVPPGASVSGHLVFSLPTGFTPRYWGVVEPDVFNVRVLEESDECSS